MASFCCLRLFCCFNKSSNNNSLAGLSIAASSIIDFALLKFSSNLSSISNRWDGDKEIPKSTQLANHIKESIGDNIVSILEIPKLIIHNCEGNVSTARGNTCGLKEALLKNKTKNPSGYHRCWASINNKDDVIFDPEIESIISSLYNLT